MEDDSIKKAEFPKENSALCLYTKFKPRQRRLTVLKYSLRLAS